MTGSRSTLTDDERRHEYRRYLSDHPGHPLGRGYPLGRATRIEWLHEETGTWRGESHLDAWSRVIRADPCSYCGAAGASKTVDHIEPRGYPTRGLGGAYSWANLAGACEACNGSKKAHSLLYFMAVRRAHAPKRKERELSYAAG